jgi:hypothetical protein
MVVELTRIVSGQRSTRLESTRMLRSGVTTAFVSGSRFRLFSIRFAFLLHHRVNGERGMRGRSASPHLIRDPDRVHDLLFGRTPQDCSFGMAADAIWALRDVRHGRRHQILRLRRERPVGKDTPAK